MQEGKWSMGLKDIIKRKSNEFTPLLIEQVDLMVIGLELLMAYLEKRSTHT